MDEIPRKIRSTRRWWIPVAWIALGLAAGIVYGEIDDAFDSSLVTGGPLHAFEAFHRGFNTIIPPIAGMVVGLLIAYLRQRGELIEAERRATETVRNRLAGVERQQATWLLASSLLHEIRGPLHAMGLLLEEMEGSDVARRDDALAELLSKASKQAEKIEERIASLRKLAESPRSSKAEIDVGQLLQRIVTDVGELARARGVTVAIRRTQEATVYADEWAIRTSIENLVTNAIEAAAETPPPKLVRLESTCLESRPAVLIADSGRGIESQIRENIFEPLQTGKRRGLGLGLPLSRALARREGGDVKLLKSDENGTTFGYYLPVGATEES
jgi:two-component system sensor kinase FixL